MLAHADDLRAEVDDGSLVEVIADDYRRADLPPRQRAMLDYALRLTTEPAAMTVADVDALRAVGFDDVAVHDIAQVAAYFNYINRIADGLGVDPEPRVDRDSRTADGSGGPSAPDQ